MPSTPSRRRFLAASAATCVALAGCTDLGERTDTASETPPPTPTDADRPTRTPRDRTPVDVRGAWPQPGYGPGHASLTPAAGLPDDGTAYWQLSRLRSGPPLLSDGRLFHFGLTGDDPDASPTRTKTPPTGTGRRPEGALTLFCRDASDGHRRWARTLPGRVRSATVAGGRLVAAGEGFLAAYRPDDGREAWRADLGFRRGQVSTAVDGSVLVSTAFFGRQSRKPDVRAYSAADGSPRWKQPSPRWQADLAASGDTVLSLSARFQVGTVLTARSLADGSERWSVEFDDNGIPAGPYVAGETVYVAPDDDGVHALDLESGERRWHYAGETSNRVGLAASADTAYLVDDGRLLAVDAADGAPRWETTPAGDHRFRGVPAVGAETVYLEKAAYPAEFAALSRADGSERWTYRLPETVVEGDMVVSGLAAQPIVAEGAVYGYAWDGLYAFGPATN